MKNSIDKKLDYYSKIHELLNIEEEQDSGDKVLEKIRGLLDIVADVKENLFSHKESLQSTKNELECEIEKLESECDDILDIFGTTVEMSDIEDEKLFLTRYKKFLKYLRERDFAGLDVYISTDTYIKLVIENVHLSNEELKKLLYLINVNRMYLTNYRKFFEMIKPILYKHRGFTLTEDKNGNIIQDPPDEQFQPTPPPPPKKKL